MFRQYLGQDPVCFDVNSKSGSVLDLFSDNTSSLEINALFKVRVLNSKIDIGAL